MLLQELLSNVYTSLYTYISTLYTFINARFKEAVASCVLSFCDLATDAEVPRKIIRAFEVRALFTTYWSESTLSS